VQKPKERTLIGPAEAPLNRARSSRNAGRNHLGTPSEIKSECWATSSRIRGRLPSESAHYQENPRDKSRDAYDVRILRARLAAENDIKVSKADLMELIRQVAKLKVGRKAAPRSGA